MKFDWADPGSNINLIRQYIPPNLRKILSRTKTYHRRIKLLQEMKSQFEGETDEDTAILQRSFAEAPRRLLRSLDTYKYPTLLDDATVRVREFGTFKVRRQTDDLAHIMPSFQKTVLDTAKQFAKAGATVIDAGANIGAMTYALSNFVGSGGRVLAIEMMPDNAAVLRENICLNGLDNVILFENALSDEAGRKIVAKFEPGLHGQASIARQDDRTGLIDVPVESVTLDQITDGCDEIAFIKMDLEGAEPLALAGGTETLRRTRAMIVEVWYPDTDPTPRILTEAGFSITFHGLDVLAVRDL